MRQWPWITSVATAVALVSPFGQDLIYLAFFSGEQLSRNIAQPFVFIGLAIFVLLGALEFWFKRYIRRRRALQTER
jgi:tellurite resistance protein TehA-like permease